MAFSQAGLNYVLTALTGKQSGSILGTCYIGLSTTVPDADGGNFTEPSDASGYKRSLLGAAGQGSTQKMGDTTYQEVEDVLEGTIANKDMIFFDEATASWGSVVAFGLFNSETGGTPVVFGELTAPATVGQNYVAIFRVGQLSLSLK